MDNNVDLYDLCVFKGCLNSKYTWQKMLFPFPRSSNPRYDIWLENCGNKAIIDRSNIVKKAFGICCDHFTPDSFYDEEKKKLRRDAVPEPYSPTFKRMHPFAKPNARINDHNYALSPIDIKTMFTDYAKSKKCPLKKYNACNNVQVSSDIANNNFSQTTIGRSLESSGIKKQYSLAKPCTGKSLKSDENKSVIGENSAELKNVSRITEHSNLTALISAINSKTENVMENKKRRRASKVQRNNLQVGDMVLKNGEVNILQETNQELRTQNKLLKKLNGKLKIKMKKCEDRNKTLKITLEKVSSIDGFLDLHRCTKLDVRNLIKEQIRNCKIPSGSK